MSDTMTDDEFEAWQRSIEDETQRAVARDYAEARALRDSGDPFTAVLAQATASSHSLFERLARDVDSFEDALGRATVVVRQLSAAAEAPLE